MFRTPTKKYQNRNYNLNCVLLINSFYSIENHSIRCGNCTAFLSEIVAGIAQSVTCLTHAPRILGSSPWHKNFHLFSIKIY